METIVVASLLSTVLLFSMALIPSFKVSNRRASHEFRASVLAQSAIEEARAANFSTLANSSRTLTVNDLKFTENVVVTPSPSGLTKTVRVTISWEDKDRPRELFRESVICQIPR